MALSIKKLIASKNITLLEALKKIKINKKGIIFFHDENNALVGCLSDGDMRQHIIESGAKFDSYEMPASNFMNQSPCHLHHDDPALRQKALDLHTKGYKLIPIVDKKMQVKKMIEAGKKWQEKDLREKVMSISPLRCTLSGGGTDLSAYYSEHGGAVISFSIRKYVRCILESSNKIEIVLPDIGYHSKFSSLESLANAAVNDGPEKLALIAVLNSAKKDSFKITLWSDVSVGSGLAGSTSVVAAIVKAFDQRYMFDRKVKDFAEEIFNIERVLFNQLGGWQDQYITSVGGLSFISFGQDGNNITPLKISSQQKEIFENSLYIVDTNLTHDSDKQQESLKKSFKDAEKIKTLNIMKKNTFKLRDKILSDDISDLGKILDENWSLKRKTSELISNKKIDQVYQDLKKFGADGGKLIGSGGGGYFLVFVNIFKSLNFMDHCANKKYQLERVNIDEEGTRAWEIS